jgi:hypothetical protein
MLAYPFTNVANGRQKIIYILKPLEGIERVTRFALPVGPFMPSAGNILRRRLEPEILQVDEQKLFVLLS